jgi:hypothetical protein
MREGVSEIIPGKLYQRGQFMTWFLDRKMEFLKRNGITAVVNLWGKIDPELEGIRYFVWPLRSNNPDNIDDLAIFVHNLMVEGDVVLVHCEAGVNRSVWLCTKLLMLYDESLSAQEALDQVSEKVGRTKVNKNLFASLLG